MNKEAHTIEEFEETYYTDLENRIRQLKKEDKPNAEKAIENIKNLMKDIQDLLYSEKEYNETLTNLINALEKLKNFRDAAEESDREKDIHYFAFFFELVMQIKNLEDYLETIKIDLARKTKKLMENNLDTTGGLVE